MTTDELLMKLAGLGVHKSKLRKYLERHFPDLLGEVMSRTAFLDSDGPAHPFAERTYCLRAGMTGPMSAGTGRTARSGACRGRGRRSSAGT